MDKHIPDKHIHGHHPLGQRLVIEHDEHEVPHDELEVPGLVIDLEVMYRLYIYSIRSIVYAK